tara:strand:- start:592 stop:1065 length:474 start_codon:yes stop_codon:yes gene_type:complete
MKKVLATFLFLAITPIAAFSGGHGIKWEGHGFSQVVDVKQIKGKSGMIVSQKTSDFWDWPIVPEGFPAAVSPECSQSIALDQNGNLLAAVNTCELLDSDGDIAIFTGIIDSTGSGKWQLLTGTGKYADYDGNGTFQTVTQISDTQSKYVFSGHGFKK